MKTTRKVIICKLIDIAATTIRIIFKDDDLLFPSHSIKKMDSKEEVDKFKMQLFHVKTHKKRRSHNRINYIYKAALSKQGATANANHWYFLKAPHYISSSLGAPVHCVRCLQILNSLRLYFLLTSAAHCDYVCT